VILKTGKRLAIPAAVAMLVACGKESEPTQSATPAPAAPSAPAATPAPTSPAQPAPVAEATPAPPPESSVVQYAQAGLPDTLLKDGCYSCHDVNGARIGPPLRAVAGLYRTDPQAVEKLTQKIIHGGGGVWGPTPMIAHPQLAEAEVRAMVEAILKLQ
jgi:cytochrome c